MVGSSKGDNPVAVNLQKISERVRAAQSRSGSAARDVCVIAVSKLQTDEAITLGIKAGVRNLGENYVQELERKVAHFGGGDLRWHLIGPLQSNKAKFVVGKVALIHTVDRLSLAEVLDRLARERGVVQEVLIQVNVAGEGTKNGVEVAGVEDLLRGLTKFAGIQVRGLMTMPPFVEDPELSRPHFKALRLLRDELNAKLKPVVPLEFLSMGTSQDFEVAVEEGATHIRVGTILFGERHYS